MKKNINPLRIVPALMALALFFALPVAAQVTRTLDLETFHTISNNSSYDVIIKQSNKQEISVKVDAEIWEATKIKVEDGVLHINVERTDDGSKKSVWAKIDNIKLRPVMEINVTMTTIKKLVVNGNGSIKSENSIDAPNLEVEMNGEGKVSLDVKSQTIKANIFSGGEIAFTGYCSTIIANVNGSGKLAAFTLDAMKGDATVRGKGNCEIKVSDNLNAVVYGSGTVAHKGNTKNVVKNIYGDGKVDRAY